MAVTNPLFYFLLMAAFIIFVGVAGPLFSFYRRDIESKASAPGFSAPLEGLRGLLALSVLIHHGMYFYLWFAMNGLWALDGDLFLRGIGPHAVTVFFFLSGFLFWSKLMRDPLGLRPAGFYKRRFLRLMPAYACSVAFVVFLVFREQNYALKAPLGELLSQVARWLAFGFPDGQFHAINGVSYAKRIGGGIAWTLRPEIVFYAMLPFLAWFARGRRVFILLVGAAAVWALLARAYAPVPLFPFDPDPIFTSPGVAALAFLFCVITGFGWGMIGAFLRERFDLTALARRPWIPLVSLAAAAFGFKVAHGFMNPLSSAAFFVAFLPFLYGNDLFGLLRRPSLIWLGTVSYGVYLLHAPFLFWFLKIAEGIYPIRSMTPFAYWSVVGYVGFIVIGASSAMYRFVEAPCMNAARQ